MQAPEQINLYIANHPEWQRRTMVRLRQLIHSTSSGVEESWRSQCPHFDVAGQPMLNFSASKTSVCVHFPKGAQFKSTRLPYEPCADEKQARIVKFREGEAINEAAFTSLVGRAAALNRKLAKASAEGQQKDPLFTELEAVLRKDPSAWANWETFSRACRREYAEWVADGRKEETRKRRIAQAFEMIREGLTKEEEERRIRRP